MLLSKFKKTDTHIFMNEISENSNLNFLKNDNDSVLLRWINYYKSFDSNFSLNKFEKMDNHPIQYIDGNVLGVFDEKFDDIYMNFLIYSPNKEMYIDFDSYAWFVYEDDDKSEIFFDIDQEINLVNISKKTVTRIAFRGVSDWVEDAYWINDNTVVLLENSSENKPTVSIFNLEDSEVTIFIYQNTITQATSYSMQRMEFLLNKE